MSTTLSVGQSAPEFSLPDQAGKRHNLSDFRSHRVLLYFYPKDNTPGCTVEAINFAEGYAEYTKRKVVVLGISTDSVASHRKFAEKFSLPFPLLADENGSTTRAYGAQKPGDSLTTRARRITFLIGPDGRIEKIWDPVSAKTHHEDVLAFLDGKE